jgi:hypothetical protein
MINIQKMINMLYKSRDKLLKNKAGMSIIIYFTLLFTIDYLGIMDLYGQNILRRCINMRRRIDPLCYEKKLKPFCKKYEKMLVKNDISKLQSIKITDKKDFGLFGLLSRTNTTTHQCCDGWSKEEKNIITEVSEKVRKMYEQRVGKKLYYLESNKATIYRYHGNSSHHLWHVDPQNISTIYNVIICIKKKGEISPLECKNKKGDVNSIHFEEGDGALFNGGTTVHQVPPNDDPNSERTVLSIAFTSDESASKNENRSNNLCTFLEGGNNYLSLFKILMLVFITNLVLSQLSSINSLSYKSLIIFFGFNLLIAKYIPYYFDIGLGSNRPSSIYDNLELLLFFIIGTISIKGAIVFFSYFLLSDVLFSRSWVEYD